jgi:type I restriction enzyme S subunit
MAWKKMKLSEALINREGRYKPNDNAIANLKRIDKINFSGNIFLSNKGSNTDMILIKKGDLVISGINVEKGAIAVYEGEEDITATIHYSSYVFNTEKIDIEFLKVFLRSPDFILLLKEQVPGGIKTEIKPKHIMPLEVYFPDTLEEQRKIANHFFEKEKKFKLLNENLSHQLNQIENLNQAILQEAVQGKLVKQDKKDEPASELLKRIKAEKLKSGKKEKPLPPIKPEEIPFEIPENWVWCKIGDVSTSIVPNRDKPKTFTGNIPWITQSNFSDFSFHLDYDLNGIGLNEEEVKEYNCRVMPKGSVIMSCVGQFDLVCFIERDIVANQQLHCFVPFGKIEPMYLCYSLKLFSKLMEKEAIHTTIKYINKTKCESILLPLPPLPEQKRIVVEIEKQLAKTKQLKEHIIANQQATEQLLKALLHQAFEVEEMEEV